MAGIDKCTKLLLHLDGVNNGTTFTDSSQYDKAITKYGNTCTRTSGYKFGGSSGYFDGNGDYLTLADHADWYFGNEDFTLEAWIMPTVQPAANVGAGIMHQYTGASTYWTFSYHNGGVGYNLRFEVNTAVIIEYAIELTLFTWYHVAIAKCTTGGVSTTRLFLDGTIVATYTSSYTMPDLAAVLCIGAYSTTWGYFTGYMDEVRVSKYISRWVANFTPMIVAYFVDLDNVTRYINPATGNDNLPGESWATAWKSIKYGAAVGSISPGYTIKIAKSPDAVSIGSATWTSMSKTITLASSTLTKNIDLCEATWTGSTNVTTTADTAASRKQGTYSSKHVIGATFTTGKIAYKALGASTSFADYTGISLWFVSTVEYNTVAWLKVCLCSDTIGNDIVNEFIVPILPTGSSAYWSPVTIPYGGALSDAIQSVAIYAISDPGATTLNIDNIIAVNSLSLTSLISKNSSTYSGAEAWYGIQSINGATVMLDTSPASGNTASVTGYYGVTGDYTAYIRSTDIVVNASDNTVMVGGTAGNLVTFQGGWDTALDEVTGETIFDVVNGSGYGIHFNSKSYVKVTRVSAVRCISGILAETGSYIEYQGHTLANCQQGNSITCDKSIFNITAIVNNYTPYSGIGLRGNSNVITVGLISGMTIGIDISGSGHIINFTSLIGPNAGTTYGIYFRSAYYIVITGALIRYCYYGISFTTAVKCRVHNISFWSNTNNISAYPLAGCVGVMRNCTFVDGTLIINGPTEYESGIALEKVAGDANDNRFYGRYYNCVSQTAVRHTASGVAWKLSVTDTTYVYAGLPAIMSLGKIAVAANAEVTIYCYMRRTNTGLTAKLYMRGGQLVGVESDVVSAMTVAADTWEQVHIHFTPSEAGVVEFGVLAYGGTTYSVYIDDVSIT